MKKLLTVVCGCIGLFSLNSCGVLSSALTHGKSTVFMMRAPKDIEVTSGGKKLELTRDVFAAKSRTSSNGIYNTTTTTSYYATGVKLPSKKKATIEIYSPSENKRATVDLKPRANRNIIWADLLLSGGAGLIPDIATGCIKFLTPRLVDVESALAGKPRKEWLSQGKLKRMAKRGADKQSKKKY